jgi:hypothetical protein
MRRVVGRFTRTTTLFSFADFRVVARCVGGLAPVVDGFAGVVDPDGMARIMLGGHRDDRPCG